MLLNAKYAVPASGPEPENSQFPGSCTAISGLRYYSPSLGRFINHDPIEEQGGLNLYAFCLNNGVNCWDHLGMFNWPKALRGYQGLTFSAIAVAGGVGVLLIASGPIITTMAVVAVVSGIINANLALATILNEHTGRGAQVPKDIGDAVTMASGSETAGALTNLGIAAASFSPPSNPDSIVQAADFLNTAVSAAEDLATIQRGLEPPRDNGRVADGTIYPTAAAAAGSSSSASGFNGSGRFSSISGSYSSGGYLSQGSTQISGPVYGTVKLESFTVSATAPKGVKVQPPKDSIKPANGNTKPANGNTKPGSGGQGGSAARGPSIPGATVITDPDAIAAILGAVGGGADAFAQEQMRRLMEENEQ